MSELIWYDERKVRSKLQHVTHWTSRNFVCECQSWTKAYRYQDTELFDMIKRAINNYNKMCQVFSRLFLFFSLVYLFSVGSIWPICRPIIYTFYLSSSQGNSMLFLNPGQKIIALSNVFRLSINVIVYFLSS